MKLVRMSEISELQDLLALVLGAVQIAFTIAGGAGPLKALILVWPLVTKVKPVITNISKVLPELTGLDAEARQALKDQVASFEIDNKQIQDWIISALNTLIDLSASVVNV